jgi:hypothetical protein
MGWLMVDLAAVRMDLIIGVFVKNFARRYRWGVLKKSRASNRPLPGRTEEHAL